MGALALASPLADLEREQQALYRSAAPSVVFLSHDDGFGSGFLVSADGLILTNAHVVADHDTMQVVLSDGRTLEGVVRARAEKLDLALVDLPGLGYPVLPLSTEPDAVQVGAWAASIGHGRGGIWTYTTGMVSNRYADRGTTVFQTQIPVNPGNSGGPVLDRSGAVIGVVTSKLRDAESINFAIPVFEAVRALDGLSGQCRCLVIRAPAGAPVFVDGLRVGEGPEVRVPVEAGDHAEFAIIGGRKVDGEASWPDQPRVTLE